MSIPQDAGTLLAGPRYSAFDAALLPAPHARQPGFFEIACRAFPRGRNLALKRLRYFVRAWRDRHAHATWLRFLDTPQFGSDAFAERLPQLYQKIQRSYVLRALDTADARVRLLQDHYRGFFASSRTLGEALHSRHGLLLSELELADATYQLRLCHLPLCWREGEISLGLFDGAKLICSLTFVVSGLREFTGDAGGAALVIGGIQGVNDAEGLRVFRDLTKAMHGLRPFSLLIHAIRTVALALGAQRVVAVGDAQHALSDKRARNKVHVCYDEIWSDHGGTSTAGGLYDLSTTTSRKSIADIASNKRAQYRRRYQLMDEVERGVMAAIASVGH